MMQEQEILNYFRLFYPIPEKDCALFTGRLHPRHFQKGELIVTPGQVQKELYLVQSGVQMSYAESETGQHVIAFTYPPNLCAIPESFSPQQPSGYYLQAMTASEMAGISHAALMELFDESRELERLFRKMTEALLAGMIRRHIELQSLSITERFTVFCQRSGHLLHKVPHKYIASYLGIDPTNFSKLYNTVKF